MKQIFLTLLLFATLFSTATAQYFPIDTARLNNSYMAPEAELIAIKALTMVATYIGIGEGEADAWQSFSNEY